MFPKCSLDIPNIATLMEHSENIPVILCASWIDTMLCYLALWGFYQYFLTSQDPEF